MFNSRARKHSSFYPQLSHITPASTSAGVAVAAAVAVVAAAAVGAEIVVAAVGAAAVVAVASAEAVVAAAAAGIRELMGYSSLGSPPEMPLLRYPAPHCGCRSLSSYPLRLCKPCVSGGLWFRRW